jgi:hypothetical protein
MLITALGVGLLAAYYFGVQPAIWAAAAAAALSIGTMIPALKLYAYVGLALEVAGLIYLGPKLGKPNSAAGLFAIARGLTLRARDALGLGAKKDARPPRRSQRR